MVLRGERIRNDPDLLDNLQTWAEHNYDTRLLHRNLAFPLLRKLTQAGDPNAKNVFKEEVAKRFLSGNLSVITYLKKERYLDDINEDDIKHVIPEIFLSKNISVIEYLIRKGYLNNLNKEEIKHLITEIFLSGDISVIEYLRRDGYLNKLKEEEIKHLVTEIFLSGNLSAITYMITEEYLDYLDKEEIKLLLEDFNFNIIKALNFEKFLDILQKLAQFGEKNVKKIFKEEIAKRFLSGNISVITYMINEEYLDYLDKEEIKFLLEDFNFNLIKALEVEKSLDLLEKLAKLGGPIVKKIFKEEITKRFLSGNLSVITFLLNTGYLGYLNKEEIKLLLQDFNFNMIKALEVERSLDILQKLAQFGDTNVKKVFKEEIVQKFLSGNLSVKNYKRYLKHLNKEEIKEIKQEMIKKKLKKLKKLNEKPLNLTFPLLNTLTERGDPIAKKRFKEEIAIRFASGHRTVQMYLKKQGYLKYLGAEELEFILDEINLPIIEEIAFKIKPKLNNIQNRESKRSINNSINKLMRVFPLNSRYLILLPLLKKFDSNSRRILTEFIAKKFKKNNRFLLLQFVEKTISYFDERILDYVKSEKGLLAILIDKELDLKNQNIENIANIKGLEQIQNDVEILDLSHNKISNIKGLDGFTNLRILNLKKNCISEIKNINILKKLEILDLSYNVHISEIPESLNELSSLQKIKLRGCRIKKFSESVARFFWMEQNYRSYSNYTNREVSYYEKTHKGKAMFQNKLFKRFVNRLFKFRILMRVYKFSFSDIDDFETKTGKPALYLKKPTFAFYMYLFDR